MPYGIDISHWQSIIDFHKVKASGKVHFAIIKATEGSSIVDSRYATNRRHAAEVGIPSGAYHYYRPTVDAERQADLFYKTVGALDADDIIPWIDVEYYTGPNSATAASVQNLAMMVLHCEERFGKPVGIYTASWAWDTLPHGNRFASLPLWVASWNVPAGQPALPEGWRSYAVHQYTSKGSVSGINGNVDMNYTPNLAAIQRKPQAPSEEQKMRQVIADIRDKLTALEQLIGK